MASYARLREIDEYRALHGRRGTARGDAVHVEFQETWPSHGASTLTPEDEVAGHEDASRVMRLVWRLPWRERLTVRATMNGIAIGQVARALGIHKSGATRLHQRALQRLQD